MPNALQIGVDFGTTNSSVAIAHSNGHVELLTFPTLQGAIESFRSVLYLEQQRQGARATLKSFTGPAAIEQYLAADTKGRLIQSLKSYLPSRTLTGTEVFGRRYTLEDLVARILTDLRITAEAHLAERNGGPVRPIRHATVGRPVRFVGADTPEDDLFAESRLRAAFLKAGFEHIAFELEPIAAARAYASTLPAAQTETVLIGDFGGGTSDFSLLRVGSREGRTHTEVLGNAGLGLAGDAFDARIVRHLVSPAIGSDSFERSFAHAVDRPPVLIPAAPAWIYRNLERWHYLSFLKTRNVAEILKAAHRRAEHPDEIAALITLIDEDLGYQLHQAVQRLKIELSHHETATFSFRDGSMNIRAEVTRADFESWIADDLHAIETTIDTLLATTGLSLMDATTGLSLMDIDRVFLTGGTSFVPAVRRLFEARFTPARIRTGNEFTSVAQGLALSPRVN